MKTKTVTFDAGKWRLVPIEPTEEMLDAAGSIAFAEEIKADYSAMIAAAPQPGRLRASLLPNMNRKIHAAADVLREWAGLPKRDDMTSN